MTTVRAGLHGLDAALTVAELSRAVIDAEAAGGWNVAGARRPLSDVEWASGVRFGWLAERETTLSERLLRATDPIEQVLTGWLSDITDGLNPRQTVEVVAAAASPVTDWQPPTMRDVSEQVTATVVGVLWECWEAAAGDVLREAHSQHTRPNAGIVAMDEGTRTVVQGLATQLVAARASRVLAAALDAARDGL